MLYLAPLDIGYQQPILALVLLDVEIQPIGMELQLLVLRAQVGLFQMPHQQLHAQ
jgi:hypothetical protein